MDALLSLAVSNAVVATLLAVAASLVSCFCRRPAVRHALWLLVLLKLLTPPLIPLPIAWPRESDSLPTSPASMPHVETLSTPVTSTEPIVSAAPVEDVSAFSPESAESLVPPIAELWMPAVLAFWLSGSLVWWTIAGLRLTKFRRLLREVRAAPSEVQKQAARLAFLLGLRRCPPVAFLSAPLSPMLWALGFSPRLLLPEMLWRRLGAEQQDALLAHELAHLRRGDHWVRRLEFVVLGLYWWHPVVWWARRRLQEAEEECCDALVVTLLPDAASAYASALVETVAFLSHTHAAAPVGASGAGQVPLLKRRLTMILSATPSGRPSRAGFWAVLGLGALLLPMTPGAGRSDPPDPPHDSVPRQPPDVDKTARPADKPTSFFSLWLKDDFLTSDPHKDVMNSCMSCHDNPHRMESWLQRQHAPWREKHDEAARLLGQLRQQSPMNTPGANQEVDRERLAREQKAEIEKLQDEIELLKVQVRLKEVQLRSARRQLESSIRHRSTLQQQIRSVPGSIPREDVRKAELDAETQGDQAQIREVELQESMIRLKQAERRLAKLQPSPKPPAKVQSSQEQRLKDLEKKLNQVLEEMKALQSDLHPKKPLPLLPRK